MTDLLTAACVDAGHTVEGIAPGVAYRVIGDYGRLQALAEQVNALDGYSLGVEQPPPDAVHLVGTLAPPRPFRRTIVVHGRGAAYSYVARAIDMRLPVVAVGPCRWSVTGRTADLLAWLSEHVHGTTVDEALKLHGLTIESARAEDHDLPIVPVIKVQLPARVRTTKIKRDDDGSIVDVLQREDDEE